MVKSVKTRSAAHKRRDGRAIPRASFVRLIKEIASEVSPTEGGSKLKWSKESIDGLQETTEAYVEKHFARANKLLDAFEQRTLGLRHFSSAGELAS